MILDLNMLRYLQKLVCVVKCCGTEPRLRLGLELHCWYHASVQQVTIGLFLAKGIWN